ncbi:olfactory receptor 1020-like isoform X1 [Rhinatrema bivittatum]|uniref:olfactory receptor 1020-like isoform X1 n=1 Tax=Rhinatrema bivittatum TaxID=194408 RepID=UPI00112DAB46|nr:olfactory receptor 1020-like isoform X1 [Rhinatrema bivittatum]
MEGRNQTSVTEFILLGLTDHPILQILLFVFFLLVYIITLLANTGIIVLTWLDVRLQTPMYFFLSHLSFVDICYSSATTPKNLQILLGEKKSISFLGCALQMYFFIGFGASEGFLLTVMAFDRYVAICNPLLYSVIMNSRVCIQLMTAVYLVSFVISLIQTIFTFRLSFCESNVINHFFCDIPPLLLLSCSDTSVNEVVSFIIIGFNCIISLLTILISYIYIISTILRIRSAEGRHKTFSTCASHFTAVLIFFGTILFMNLQPPSSYSLDQEKAISVFYTMVIPMLNPLIYSLKNKEVKAAMSKIFRLNFAI